MWIVHVFNTHIHTVAIFLLFVYRWTKIQRQTATKREINVESHFIPRRWESGSSCIRRALMLMVRSKKATLDFGSSKLFDVVMFDHPFNEHAHWLKDFSSLFLSLSYRDYVSLIGLRPIGFSPWPTRKNLLGRESLIIDSAEIPEILLITWSI